MARGKKLTRDTFERGDALTRDFVRTVEPDPGKTRFYFEGGGFALRVTPNGARSYVLNYRTPQGQTRRATLGSVGDIDLTTARKRAAAWRDKLRQGVDPAEEIEERRDAATVAELWERVRDEHLSKRAASTRRMYKAAFERHLLPRLGRRRVDAVRWEDLAAIHAEIAAGAPFQANRLLAVASKAWKLAARWGWWPRDRPNPAADHDRPAEPRRGRAFEVGELAAIGKALEADKSTAAKAIRVVFLVGARPCEIYTAKWADLEDGGRVLHLPRAKTGERDLYLGAPAADLVAELPRLGGYLFPGRDPKAPLTSLRAAWERVRAVAELPADARLYNARHTWISTAAALGVPEDRRRRLSGHAKRKGDAHAGYVHLPASVLLADADRVAGSIDRAMRGEAGEVLEFKTQ